MPALPVTHVLNASYITEQLLVGGDLDPDDDRALAQIVELQAHGVRHIFDARVEWSDRDFVLRHAPEMSYAHIGIDDAGQQVPDAWFDQVVPPILVALTQRNRILIHCHMGINRGPSVALAALLADGWDVVDAMTRLRQQRPIAGVAYAEDVLRWHLRRTAASPERCREERRRLAAWRAEHPLDVVRVIRRQRAAERAAWGRVATSRYRAS